MDKSIFLRFYPNLPINVRRDVILNSPEIGGPITWEVAYREIQGGSEIGEKILRKLIDLKFIPANEDELKTFTGENKK
jgi:hypothetical protein